MTDRRVRLRRRLTAWFAATLLGAVGALTIVTPAHAATTCTLTLRAIAWPAADGHARWDVEAALTNTGTTQSLSWLTLIHFPYSSGAVVPQYWNVRRSPTSTSVWSAADWDKIILPGNSAGFGFEVDMPTWDISPLPASTICGIAY